MKPSKSFTKEQLMLVHKHKMARKKARVFPRRAPSPTANLSRNHYHYGQHPLEHARNKIHAKSQ